MALVINSLDKELSVDKNLFVDYPAIHSVDNIERFDNVVLLGNIQITEVINGINLSDGLIDDGGYRIGSSFYSAQGEMTEMKNAEIYLIANFSVKFIKENLGKTSFSVSYSDDYINIVLSDILIENIGFSLDIVDRDYTFIGSEIIMCYIKLTN